MKHLVQEINELLDLSADNSSTERLIAACIRMGTQVYGKDDPRARDPLTFRNIERPSKRFYAAHGYLEDLRSYLINSPPQTNIDSKKPNTTRKVFLVHGHDDAMRQTVARYLEQLDFVVIELSEQPNMGKTIIEKLEANADVDFVVVLLTPDDIGAKAGSLELVTRARQNVIFELGFFLGRLGRERVVLLYKPAVEIPSDFHGVVYILYDDNGGWKNTLARELRSAGYEISTDNIL